MNFEISEITDPVETNKASRSGAFTNAVNVLPLGKAFVVKGMLPTNVASRVNALGKMCAPRRKFSTATLPDGAGVQVTRVL